MPRVLLESPLVLVLGPRGVGKTSVALRVLAGQPVTLLVGSELREAAVRAVRRRRWPEELVEAPGLIIDGPIFLDRRPGATRLLQQLIEIRATTSLRTVVCEGDDGTAILLAEALEPHRRATVNLRFPAARGRRRFLREEARALGLDPDDVGELAIGEPWTYLKVRVALQGLTAP